MYQEVREENKRPIVLIVYDYFFPGYQAGGPVQSLVNLVVALVEHFDFHVYTSAYDMNVSTPYNDVKIDSWNDLLLPNAGAPVKVFYSGTPLNNLQLKKLIITLSPSTIYLNGLYSFSYFLRLIVASKRLNFKIVICPRGMLQKGALAVKPFKKQAYLSLLRITGWLNKIYWHATNTEEANDIRQFFPKYSDILIAPNIPKAPIPVVKPIAKRIGELRLCYLSLITVKKNLLGLLKVLESIGNKNISLDIYGPTPDLEYWNKCYMTITSLSGVVEYRGIIPPENVQDTISKYHALILLTKGENFGHVLYEALGAGRPVITSFYTPLHQLEQQSAGYNVDIDDVNDCQQALLSLANSNQEEYNKSCLAAHRIGKGAYEGIMPYQSYKDIFAPAPKI